MELIKCIFTFIGDNASALIALSALGLAIWQGISQRQHNRLSVKPHLVFDKVFSNAAPQVEIFISNAGVGPAVIKGFKIFLDEKEIDSSIIQPWTYVAKELNMPCTWGGGKVFFTEEAIQVNGQERIFSLKTVDDEKDPDFINELAHNELKRVQIEIEYESIYGEKFSETLNKT